MAPPGVMPSQHPMIEERSSVTQYLGRSLPHLEHHLHADARGVALERELLFHGEQDLADAEEPDHGHEEIDAAQQLVVAEGHAQLPRDRVHADARDQQARAPSR